MESNRSFSRQQRASSSSDRLLTLLSQSPPSASSDGDELSEDDVFWIGELAGSPNSLSSASSTPRASKNRFIASKSFGRAENFGILSALPEIEQERSKNRPILDIKSSSTRMIPIIPRPRQERTLSASMRHHRYQSAPVNVPLRMRSDSGSRRERRLLEEDEIVEEEDEEGEMLPPHEIVAKQALKLPILSCSVLEGAGRTLKGRDLRQVRNAVFRQTGFLD